MLGFPCNQFGAQEPGTDAEILAFATENYDVNFPLFSKIEVNGDGTCGLYSMLKAAHADENGNADIGWNFTKFLVDGAGTVVARYGPMASPEDIRPDVEALLG